jgi:hypothetical protein
MTPLLGILCAVGLSFEVGAGGGASEERYGSIQAAPALSLRSIIDSNLWSIGVRGLLVGSPGYASGANFNPHNGG